VRIIISRFSLVFALIQIDTSGISPPINKTELFDLADDHKFIAPHEICNNAIGLFSILVNRFIIDMSFTKLYQQR